MIKLLGKLHRFLFYLLILFLPIQLGKHFWPEWAMVSGIRIDYLAPTIYLTDILVLCLLVVWIIDRRLWDVNFRATIVGQKFTFILGFSGGLILVLVGILRSVNPLAGFYKLLKIVEFFLLGFYVRQELGNNRHAEFISASQIPKRVRNDVGGKLFSHLSLLSISVIYSSLIAWGQFLKQSSIGEIFWWLGERTFSVATPGIARMVWNGRLLLRPYATFPHPNVLAGYLAAVLPLIISKFQAPNFKQIPNFKSQIKNILRILAIVLGIATLFITFSRAAWVVGGMGIVVSLMLLSFRGERRLRRKRWLLIIGLLSCYLAILLLFGKERLGQLRFDSKSIKIRQELNQVAIEMIKKRPFTGVGLNNFIPSLAQFKKGLSFKELQPAHNIYLLIGAETGLVGLGVFVWLIVKAYQRIIKFQAPSTKSQTSTKHQAPNLKQKVLNFEFGTWNLFGIYDLGFGYLSLFISLTCILLLGLVDHYFYTLQQTQLLFALVLGMVFGIK